jgi:hypothetical protein
MIDSQPARQEQLKTTLLKLNARAWGIALGLLLGLGLALATIVLVFRGGAAVGPHLSLVAVFLPGYSVSIAAPSSASRICSSSATESAGSSGRFTTSSRAQTEALVLEAARDEPLYRGARWDLIRGSRRRTDDAPLHRGSAELRHWPTPDLRC